MKVTKEDVGKAYAAAKAAEAVLAAAGDAAVDVADAAADKAWDKYIKLREAFENDRIYSEGV